MEFFTSPEFLTPAVWVVAGAMALFLAFACRAVYRATITPDSRSEAGRYMIAHRIDELTPGGVE